MASSRRSQPSSGGAPTNPSARSEAGTAIPTITPALEQQVGVSLTDLTALFVLDGVRGFGPQKFKALRDQKLSPGDLLRDTAAGSMRGATWDGLRRELQVVLRKGTDVYAGRAARQLAAAAKHGARILTYSHPDYPKQLLDSKNPSAVLYARGAFNVLRDDRTVACVGSRGIRQPYLMLHDAFARIACSEDVAVVSGFALGADTVGHRAAFEAGGSTIAVMPCGLDRPFPPENRAFWDELLAYARAVFVSEYPFGTGAASLTLRKRNRLIVAMSRAVLISQTAADGGAMNAYRFAIEQRKPLATFVDDGTNATSGNRTISASWASGSLLPTDHALFPRTRDDEAYRTWLRTLSSST